MQNKSADTFSTDKMAQSAEQSQRLILVFIEVGMYKFAFSILQFALFLP